MRLSIRLASLAVLAAPLVVAQDDDQTSDQPSATSATGRQTQTSAARTTEAPKTTDEPQTTEEKTATEESKSSATAESTGGDAITGLPVTTSTSAAATQTQGGSGNNFLSLLPSVAGVGIPAIGVPDTSGQAFMHKSNLPDGTVFICVGAILAFFGMSVLVWRGLVAWSLHRSVKRAALTQNLADLKEMSAVPGGAGRKRGMYNVVGGNSTMSLDHLAAAPTGTSKPPKPFASNTTGTPPKSNSLFFSPTAGGSTGLRDSVATRSSNYLPAGYYAPGSSQAASGSPVTHVGGAGPASHLSAHSLATPGNRFSARSGISPPQSPSLPPSRGYDRAPPSRDGVSVYNRNSVATLGTPSGRGGAGAGVYAHDAANPSQLSLNVPGGTTTGGRAPSAYLEDLFENHGSGPRERF